MGKNAHTTLKSMLSILSIYEILKIERFPSAFDENDYNAVCEYLVKLPDGVVYFIYLGGNDVDVKLIDKNENSTVYTIRNKPYHKVDCALGIMILNCLLYGKDMVALVENTNKTVEQYLS